MKKLFKKGFTLVELVVVVAIIAILSGVSVAVYAGITDRAKQTACDSEADTIGSVIRIASLEDSDGFDFYYDADATGDKYVAWNEQTLATGDIHYSCQVVAKGAQFYTKDAAGAATIVTFGTGASDKSYATAADLLQAVYYVHENLAEEEMIGNDIEVVSDDITNDSENKATIINGFKYIADSLKYTNYDFAK